MARLNKECIIKNCKNKGLRKIRVNVDGQEVDAYVCDEDYEIISGVNYLSIEDTDLN